MSGVSQNNNTTPSPNNGHNGHSLRDMLPETFTLLDLMALRKQNVTVSSRVHVIIDSNYSEEEDYYFYGGLMEEERLEEERAMRHEERQHPGVKSIGHGKAHQRKRVVMPRFQSYLRMSKSSPVLIPGEQIIQEQDGHLLVRGSGSSLYFFERDLLPEPERRDWRFKKENRDGIVARSSEWKRHEVRRDRGLKAELNAEDALARHEFHLDRGYDLDEFGYVNIPTAFEVQYAEEIALELRLEELAELNNWDALVGNSYFSYDDYQEDEFLFDNHYSAEANAAWEEYQAQITPWLRKLPRRKTEEQQEAEYETWFLKRNRVPAEVEVLDDSPPVPPTGHRKSLAEKKLPVLRQQLFLRYESGLRQLIKKSSVGGVSKLEFKKHVNPPDENKRRRTEASERKRKEIRDGRKRKVAELSAMMD